MRTTSTDKLVVAFRNPTRLRGDCSHPLESLPLHTEPLARTMAGLTAPPKRRLGRVVKDKRTCRQTPRRLGSIFEHHRRTKPARTINVRLYVLVILAVITGGSALASDNPKPTVGDFLIRNFRFASGEELPELRIHYHTFGQAHRNQKGHVDNAILILHGTTGNGANFLRPEFEGELFGSQQPLDAKRYFLIIPDGIGHGGSSKPSDGLHARFPHYRYHDMIEAQYQLLTEGLQVDHLRLVMGTSMGGMHTWLWGELHPDFIDALMPLACLPTQISGRNRVWRRLIIDAIRNDPAWNNGEYTTQPPSLRTAIEMLFFVASNPIERQKEAPTRERADEVLDSHVSQSIGTMDANDVLYAVEASADYDPAPGLERIQVPLLAINFEDDLINPPELGIFERAIKLVIHGRAVLVPRNEETRGHGTHTLAAIWKAHLARLLDEIP